MKSVILATIAIVAGLVSACTVRTERTVVEHPVAPAQTATSSSAIRRRDDRLRRARS